MLAPDEVAAMVQLPKWGWGTKRIAGELGCSRNTVKRYLAAGGWAGIRPPQRKRRLDGLSEWLAGRFRQHCGNCDVVRQDLVREHGVKVSLRTVERAVAPLRQALQAEARACMRFETPPGKQLQIDFGGTTVSIGGEPVRVHLFVATLGYSRRPFVRAFRHERQTAWFDGLEGAFRHFDGVPQEVVFDNARAGRLLSLSKGGQMRELVRRVQADCAIAVDGNSYSVPWRLIGESVQVMVCGGQVRVSYAGQEVAVHAQTAGRRQRIVDPTHFHGVAGVARPVGGVVSASTAPLQPALLRPLAEYERVAGGGWS